VRDLAVLVVAVWAAVITIHTLDVPGALEEWSRTHEQWAIDEVTLVSLFVAAGLGVFSWRRWRESLVTIARHQATLERLRTTEGEIAAKDQLLRSVSHELRTPLTAILGYAELMGEEESIDVAEREEMIETIIRQGRDLADIVEDLLTRARTESRTLQVARVSVDLSAQVAQVLEGWNPEELQRIHFVASGPVRAGGDPARVRQIIRNLVSNAVRYGTDRIVIDAGVWDEAAWLTVSDDGPGIPPGERERIFDPYYRASHSRAVPGGVGLGLSISRQLARLMGGDLIYRREGDRSVFELSLAPRDDDIG
jgi:two-component system sensor histidine kinase MtrB